MRAIWAKFTIPVLASILILGSMGLTQQTFAQIPPGFVDFNGHCYGLTSPNTWANTELEAVSFGGHLVTINDAAENAFLQPLASTPVGGAWIGYNDIAVEGTFEWVSGEVVSPLYENWAPGEPNNAGDEDVVVYQAPSATWNDLSNFKNDVQGIIELDVTCATAFGVPPFDPTPIILHNPSPSPNDSFAGIVAISGNNVLISAASDDTAGTDTGIVHLFDGTTGALLQTFANPNPTTGGIGDGFGLSSSISGNNVLIGTPSADAGATDSGAAYLFDATTGALLQTFLNPTPSVFDSFGDAVAISGNNVLIGATRDDTGATNAGAAYLFDGTTGAILQTFLNPTPAGDDFFGSRVAISGHKVLIGALLDDTGATNAGAAYLFDGATGALLQTFLNPTPVAGDVFGNIVAISGNNVLIGAQHDDTGAFKAGAAYLFNGATGALLQTFLNPTPDADDLFGLSVSISGNNVLIAAPSDNTGAADTGAAYLFNGVTGALLQTFLNPTPDVFDGFGSTVAISGNNVLIGVARDDTDGTDVGLAYLYTATSPPPFDPTPVEILNPTPFEFDLFGYSVATNGQDIVIGAASLRNSAVFGPGSAFLFDGTGSLISELNKPNPLPQEVFGASIALDDANIIVGATGVTKTEQFQGAAYEFDLTGAFSAEYFDTTPTTVDILGKAVDIREDFVLVGAPLSDTSGFDAGIAHLFKRSDSTVTTIFKPAGPVGFGTGVSLGSDFLVVGASAGSGESYIFDYLTSGAVSGAGSSPGPSAPRATLANPGTCCQFGVESAVDGNNIVVSAVNAAVGGQSDVGIAYLFDKSGGPPIATFNNPDPDTLDQFGYSVDIFGDLVVIGARQDDAGAVDAGSVYVFDTSGNLLQTINHPFPAVGEHFGFSVSLAGDILIIGAPGNDSNPTDSGVAYLYTATSPPTPSDTTPPDPPTIDTPTDGAILTSTSVTFTGTAEAGSTVEIFDGGVSIGTTTANSPWEIIATLSEGSHSITATATDAAGNTSPASSAIAITIIPPPITNPLASTFLGGSGVDLLGAIIKFDSAGSVFIGGNADASAFPTVSGGFDTTHNGNFDAFVAKFSPDLSTMEAFTFIGTPARDEILDIVIDPSGNVYAVGETFDPTNFPTTVGAYDRIPNGGGYDAFVIKLSNDLSTLHNSTLIGGNSFDEGTAIALDSGGNVFVSGSTRSGDFPTTEGAFDRVKKFSKDVWVAKFDSDLTTLQASTLIGGSCSEEQPSRGSMKINSANQVVISGQTCSPGWPTTAGAFSPTYNGGSMDGFVVIFSNDLSSLVSSTFFGSNGLDNFVSLALDSAGNIFTTGVTLASNFPTTAGAFDTTFNGGESDDFVVKLSPDLSSLLASTYLGGPGREHGNGVIVDATDNVFIVGGAAGGFQTTEGAFDTTFNGGFADAHVTKLNNDLSSLLASTYLGGSQDDRGITAAIGPSGNLFVTSITTSPDFPTTADAFDTTHNGSFDYAITKFTSDLLATPPPPDTTPPAAPTITIPADGAILTSTSVTFSGDAEASTSIEVFDGGVSIGRTVANSPWEIIATLSEGSHSITATATDAAGNTSTLFGPITVTVVLNAPPVASFTSNAAVTVNGATTITSTSTDPNNDIVLYEWDFDYDGVTFDVDATGTPATLSYSTFGEKTLALRVTDSFGLFDIATNTVIAGNPPLADSGGPYIVESGQDLVLDATNSFDPDEAFGDSIVVYDWDFFFDGITLLHTSSDQPVLIITAQEHNTFPLDVPIRVGFRVIDSFGFSSLTEITTLTIVAPPVCTTPPPNMVSWWTGNTDASDIQDGNNGVLTNGALAGVAGKVGGAFSFDGTNYVKISASPNLDVGTGSGFTIDLWISPSDVSFRPLVEWNTGGSFGVHFWMSVFNGPGSLFANIVDTTGAFHFVESAPNVLTANTFQHVALTYDKTTGIATLYKDGVIIAQQNLGSFTPQTNRDLYLGHRVSSNFYSGLMDEVEIFDRALSQSEIQDIVNAGFAGKCEPVADTTPPDAPTLLSPSNGTVINDNTPTFDWSDVTDPSGVLYDLTVDNNVDYSSPEINEVGLTVSTFTPTTPLADDTYTWTVKSRDNAGNDALSLTFTFTIDTTPPDTSIDSAIDGNGAAVIDGGLTTSTSITFTFSGTVGVAGFECSLDGGQTFIACTSPQNFASLTVANHNFQARAIDGAGNTDPTPASLSWTVIDLSTTLPDSDVSTDVDGNTVITASDTSGNEVTEIILPPGTTTTGTIEITTGQVGQNNAVEITGVTLLPGQTKSIQLASNPSNNPKACVVDSPLSVFAQSNPGCDDSDPFTEKLTCDGVTRSFTFPDGPRNFTCTQITNLDGTFLLVEGLVHSFVMLDNTPPIITLVGVNPQAIEINDAYTELGANATDNFDGDLTGSIVINSTAVNTSLLGLYSVTYDVTDSSGNAATLVTRTVDVVDTTAPSLTIPADVTAEATGEPTVVNIGVATATDNVDPTPVITNDAPATFLRGDTIVKWTATDANGNFATATQLVTVLILPVADAGGPYQGNEGDSITLDASASTDPDGTILSYEWDLDNDGQFDDADGVTTDVTFDDNELFTVGLRVTDDSALSSTDTASVTVLNVSPSINSITAPVDPTQINTEITASAVFTDPGILDTHTALFDWGDTTTSTGTVTETGGSGTAIGTHTYTDTGIFTITVTVTDKDNDSDQSSFQFVVVYDPAGGFVTGGGWINSPLEAYTVDPTLTGKASFGFVSKYQKGKTVPTGQTQFHFKVADLNFHSTSYDWLVIAGHKATYKGDGTINGAGNFGFILFSIDANLTPSTDNDLFRIQIWDKDAADAIVYDNEIGSAEDADPTTAIQGGSIVIHEPSKGKK